MTVQFPKPTGFSSITSQRPGANSIQLGGALRSLAETLVADIDPFAEPPPEELAIEDFLRENERYADSERITKLSCPHALKAWAAERLPSLGVSYGFANRTSPDAVRSNLDERAPVCLVKFADDLTMIARFFREITDLKIEAADHSQGLCFSLTFVGESPSDRSAALEEMSIRHMLSLAAKENCLKNRVVAVDSKIEAEVIVLRKRVRLGFSPLL